MSISATLWLLFLLYWAVAARNVAPTRSADLPVPGLRTRFAPLSTLVVGAGLALQAVSVLLAVWARRHLGRNWSGAVAIAVDHELVRSGPYRVMRHPIYSAMIGMYVGTGLVSGELHALLALGMVTAAYCRKIPLEERALGEVFGPAYEAYRRETGR
jgi:protein-S-isoprenylcysteine O-methyltransferase Ste14